MENISKILVIAALLFFAIFSETYTQIKGEPIPSFNPDTSFVFQSPRPLINDSDNPESLKHAFGIDLTFSNNGFGLGAFFHQKLDENLNGFANLYVSGAKKNDEFEVWDSEYRDYRVRGKINRVYMMPLTVGVEKYIFSEEISESFKPFLSAGAGTALILSTPYSKEFFSSFGSADFYARFAAFVGFGTYISSKGNNIMGLNVRYYYIPFGGSGIQSVINEPMMDLGGLYLSLSIGSRF